jgi:hypothetical protein
MGLSYTGSICLLTPRVSGNSLEPEPPAKIIPFIISSLQYQSCQTGIKQVNVGHLIWKSFGYPRFKVLGSGFRG